jgi:CubicO group peptidase (beta-lactamase class C family)
MSIRKIFIWFLFIAILALLPLVFVVRLRGQEQGSVPAYWPTEGWRSNLPEEQGFDSAELAGGLQAFRQKEFNIHSLHIIRNGSVVVDAYFYPYDGQTVHDMASVTKSVMTTLIGIAADQGKLELDQPLVSFFPGRTIANPMPARNISPSATWPACHRGWIVRRTMMRPRSARCRPARIGSSSPWTAR